MRELDAIVAQYEDLKEQNISSILATVVLVEGSSYRREGARMLIDEFGNITGAISGGCLEGDALTKALHALNQGKNKLVTYDTSDENDAIIGAQLGCNGIIQVLFEPLDYQDVLNPCELLKEVVSNKKAVCILVQFNLDRTKNQIGTLLTVDENWDYKGKLEDEVDMKSYIAFSKECFTASKSASKIITTQFVEQNVFIQYYLAPVKLVIVGAGNDAQILAQQAAMLGWDVVVTDGRPTHANGERFLSSCQIIVSKPEDTLQNINIDKRTCFALMSHNYQYDLAVLKLLLKQDSVPYIGILGPLKKYLRMQDDLLEEGVIIKESVKNKIHAPIGLEIGAETPAEIGLAILAEIQSVLTKTAAKPLKKKATPIHCSIPHLKMKEN
ncbi:XdhC family protein [Flavobacterium frigidarium]|uniref:XdhC family protein n=1 Tax=Flavobacterium frigidarium TaxID=99286 RepID=UPI0030D7F179|tara:strand:- start:6378 stop:7529 length:1152 start_codon:yes stop_codon:yes gene_type:complete